MGKHKRAARSLNRFISEDYVLRKRIQSSKRCLCCGYTFTAPISPTLSANLSIFSPMALAWVSQRLARGVPSGILMCWPVLNFPPPDPATMIGKSLYWWVEPSPRPEPYVKSVLSNSDVPSDSSNRIHLLYQVDVLLHVEAIHPQKIIDHLRLVVRHPVMASRFVKEAIKLVRRVPAFRADHECGDVGEAGLQSNHHEIPHQANKLTTRQVGFGRLLEAHFREFGTHVLKPLHLGFDRADRIEILVKLSDYHC